MSSDTEWSYRYSSTTDDDDSSEAFGIGFGKRRRTSVGGDASRIRRRRSSSRGSYGTEEEAGGSRKRSREGSAQSEENQGETDQESDDSRKSGGLGGEVDSKRRKSMELSRNSGSAVDRNEYSPHSSQSSGIYGIRGLETNEATREENYIRDTARNYRFIKTHETARDRLRTVLSHGFRENPSRRRIVHDVYQSVRSWGRSHVDCGVLHEKFTGTILIIAEHEDHYHIVHDCAYSNCTCRCAFVNYLCRGSSDGAGDSSTRGRSISAAGIIGRRYSRRVVPNFDISIEHWINLAKYFEKGSRQINFMDYAGRIWIPSSEAGSVRFLEDIRHTEDGMVEEECIPVDLFDFIECRPEVHSGAAPSCVSGGGHSQGSGSEEGSKGDKLIQFLQARPTAPVNHIFNTSLWLKSKYKFYDVNSVFIKNCVRIVNNSYNELSIVDLYNHFKSLEPQNLIFNAPLAAIDNYYFSIEESVQVLNKLLIFQFNHSKAEVIEFLNNLVNVIDKLVPKKNTLYVISPPNAGKNFFFDACIHYCINFGQMGNFNRYCNFPMMECVDRRIILWNEPCMEPSAAETLKMILGGDTVNAKVKYQGDSVITRTPVIVLSNNDVFPSDRAFRSRIYQYSWKSCPMLKNYKKKPHPLSIYHLLCMYNIIQNE